MTGINELDKLKQLHKNFEAIERQTKHRYSIKDLFSDFCVLAMTSLHNQLYSRGKLPIPNFYKETHDKFERDYLDIVAKYGGKEDDENLKEEAKKVLSLFAKYLGN